MYTRGRQTSMFIIAGFIIVIVVIDDRVTPIQIL